MTTQIQETITLDVMECGKCGTHFGVPSRFRSDKLDNGETFYCPNGHPRAYVTSEVDRLKKQVADLAAERNRLFSEKASAEERARRIERRIGRGVCPWCKRTFGNLARHCEAKHKKVVTPCR